ncbi:rhomboid family intramembrane serine protease [Archaeoglobus profundus]|uniref:Rhomboid family protein n=1 Tax=Archaeoglobus profundus (strain DSM 5631 / JCM 9629 / NBRC 100127 / Av18) TaxID=572546 RepID=D2REN6_ARCPA|nr:rhomboid family intramembrane serine protease [Archaeoglobus profundus]ADB58580.1 Rhomboid family protein [Archaeoglobus profundus DSM 5631]
MEEYIPVKVKRRNPYGWNNTIIAICILIYLAKVLTGLLGIYAIIRMPFGVTYRDNIVDYLLALFPINVLSMPWQIITSIFVHADFWHLFINMFVLFFFGNELERRLGERKYLIIFFASGIAGNLAYLVYAFLTNPFIPAMGASAAIFGVMGALAIIAPEIRVVIFPLPIPVSIKVAILLFAIYDLLLLPFSYSTGVAHIAHLAGLLVGLYLGKKYRIVRGYVLYY